ncbi:hypothetical protein LEN26_004377 [Aphanomyces euteiches]|nr:hypothetical protein AeMF1_005584 [Aphanomyces euteiches]KAH9148901.1 hypothetical protein LEN26_004377 [Aphanomyces euteiches]KAH9168193.1 hypothetical protein AeNC1_017972 [Aphanomyces euteiches]
MFVNIEKSTISSMRRVKVAFSTITVRSPSQVRPTVQPPRHNHAQTLLSLHGVFQMDANPMPRHALLLAIHDKVPDEKTTTGRTNDPMLLFVTTVLCQHGLNDRFRFVELGSHRVDKRDDVHDRGAHFAVGHGFNHATV